MNYWKRWMYTLVFSLVLAGCGSEGVDLAGVSPVPTGTVPAMNTEAGPAASGGGGRAPAAAVQLPSMDLDAPRRDGELQVRLKQGADGDAVAAVVGGSAESYSVAGMNYARIVLPPGTDVGDALAALEGSALIDYAEPTYLYESQLVPDDPNYGEQYSHRNTNSERGWDIFTGTNTQVVAILDSGIDGTHPDFAGRMVDGFDAETDTAIAAYTDNTKVTPNFHGTAAAGCAVATGNNDIAVAGMDWGARLMDVTVGVFGFTSQDTAEGIDFARANGATVINMSLGGFGFSQVVQDAIDAANQEGIVVVAAMGNHSNARPFFPAAGLGVIAVGATDGDDNPANFSARGNHISVTAPGVELVTATDGDNLTMVTSGTSFSTPSVAGLCSLIKGYYGLTNQEVRSQLEETARDVGPEGFDNATGFGVIDVEAALSGQVDNVYGTSLITVTLEGNPVSGVYVLYFTPEGDNLLAYSITDSNGEAYFPYLEEGDYLISVTVQGGNASGPVTIEAGLDTSFEIPFFF